VKNKKEKGHPRLKEQARTKSCQEKKCKKGKGKKGGEPQARGEKRGKSLKIAQ